jgi:outer membrane biosynthesis protein TonB
MQALHVEKEKKERRKAMLFSFLFHIATIILLMLPLLKYPDPPPGQDGILIALGNPDEGTGPIEPGGPEEPTPVEQKEEPKPEPKPKEEVKPKEKVKSTEPLVSDQELEINRKKAIEKKEKEERDLKEKQETAERIRIAKEREEANKREEQEAAELIKNIKKGSGGTSGKSGKGGQVNGDENGKVEEGISTGTGMVGGGLGGRGVVSSPILKDDSNNRGSVVVAICLDKDGNVTEAKFQLQGSTITSGKLRDLAVSNARQWRFKPGNEERQCGIITYSFKVQ